jgi:muramoyltetrapeptide carboxypeptidase
VTLAPHWRDVSEFTAGTIRNRVADMHELVGDDSVHILMASWGGKSAAQLLPFLDYELFRTARKPICAFSDGCIILNAVTAVTGLATFYGPNVVGKLDESNYGDLRQFTQGGLVAGAKISLQSKDTSILRAGIAEGILVGGNLSSYVISVIGSRFAPTFSDCILVWESGPKSAQELDMLLTALRNSEQYSTIRAMLIGDVLLTDDSKWGNRTLSKIVADVFSDGSFPILYAPIFGHERLPNPAIPIGCPARLDTERAELTLTQSPLME